MKRICFVGASTTEGMGDETGAGWPGRLTEPHRATIVPYNLGVRGQLLAEIRARAKAECAARLIEPEESSIVFCSGMNDIAHHNGLPRTPARRARETYDGLLKDLKTVAPLIVVGPFPVYSEKMPYRSQVTGLEFDFRNEDIEEMDRAYQAIAAENRIPYLSVFPHLMATEEYAASLAAGDGLHPTGTGYQQIADMITDWTSWQALAK
jgi:lysophospholipase L1-like esterase